MTLNLKPYYDAVQNSEARVREIAARIDAHFQAGENDQAVALRPDLDETKAKAEEANRLYLSMRNADNGDRNDPAARILQVDEQDLLVGMSTKDLQQYSLLRAIHAAAESHTNPRAWEQAGLEREASEAMVQVLGRQPQGFFVPWDIQMAPLPRRTNRLSPRNAQQVGVPEYGGYLVQEELLSESFIDVLRNRLVLGMAGATTLTGLAGDVDIPKKTQTSQAYWIGEGNAPDLSQLKFGQIAARPRTVAAYLELTRKFLKQSSLDAEMMARDDLAATLAVGVDYAGLHGLGAANQPRGLEHLTGIGAVIGGVNGAVPNWGNIIGLETEVSVDNADVGRLAYVTNAKVRGILKQTEKAASTAQFIWDDDEMNGYPALVSNQIRSNLDKGTSLGVCSAIFFGNWADLVIAFWGGLDVIVDPFSKSTSGGVLITAMQDADIVFRMPESFSAMLDALTA